MIVWPIGDLRGKGKFGECNSTAGEMGFDAGMSLDKALHTILHEVLHAVVYAYGYRTFRCGEERSVQVYSSGLAMVFMDNPQLADWIQRLISQMREDL